MKCPFCASISSRVIDTRDAEGGIRRRRECEDCGRRFTTYERVAPLRLVVVKRDGRREPFDRVKIVTGIENACAKRPVETDVIEELVSSIEQELYHRGTREVTSREIGEMVIGRHDDPLSLAAVSDYFDELYSFEDLDKERILASFQGQLAESLEFPFEEVSGRFRLIDATEAVIVPYDGAAERAIAALESGDLSRWTLRRLQGYTVSVYPHVLRRLEDANAVHRISERFTVLDDASCYSENIGLEVQGDSHTDLLLVDD